MASKKDITISKSSLWRYFSFVLIGLFIVGGVLYFSGGYSQQPSGPNNPPEKVSASIDDDAVLGNEDAPVTIIEFSDYQCPFCRKFWTETLPLIKSEYIDTGKVKFVYRDFPLIDLHPMAVSSAEAAECVREIAGNDAAYFEYHDKIFGEQNIIDSGSLEGPVRSTVTYTTTDLKNWAQEIGYNINNCLDSGKFKGEVQKDLADGIAAGGQGTPYFVINDVPLSGAHPFSAFKQIIESELA